MKRIHFFLMLFLLMSYYAQAQITKTLTLTYDENDFEFLEQSGQTYISSSKYNLIYDSDTLAPALPYIGVNVLVSKNADYCGSTYVTSDSLIYESVNIGCNLPAIPTNTSSPLIAMDHTNYQYQYYPDSTIVYTGTNNIDGYKFLTFLVCPFSYNTTSKTLYLKHSITLNVSLSGSSISTGGLNMRYILEDIISNPLDMNTLYRPLAKANVNVTNASDLKYEYIIITRDSLKSSFQKLSRWKTKKGIPAKVLTIEEINNQYTGDTQQLKIKKAIKDIYDSENNTLKYVLLGGDNDIVPSQKCYIHYSNCEHMDVPVDWFYACLETINWDNNGNGLFGELSDSVSISPSIIISRLPVRNVPDVNMCVDRIITYENNSEGVCNKNILMTGNTLNNNFTGDVVCKGQKMYNTFIAPYWNGNIFRFYDTDSDFPEGGDHNLTSSNLQTELSKGYTFINMDTHGWYNKWALENYEEYTEISADVLTNNSFSLIVTSACMTNGFDADSCLSVHFMNNPYSKIIGYFGSSREGWYSPSQCTIGSSQKYNGKLFEELLSDEKHCFGEAVLKTKISFLNNCHRQSVERWLLFCLNALGDPEMSIYTDTPQMFSVNYSHESERLLVNTGIPNCRICVMREDSNGDLTNYIVKEDTDNISIPYPDEGISICITKPGYIPWFLTCQSNVYVQNETLAAQNTFIGDNVYFGRNVITTKPLGAVKIIGGKTKITAKNVLIKNSFEVQSGASLEINVEN